MLPHWSQRWAGGERGRHLSGQEPGLALLTEGGPHGYPEHPGEREPGVGGKKTRSKQSKKTRTGERVGERGSSWAQP